MINCLFCKIANKEVPADIVYEDDMVVAFKDIHPLAPIHILIIPKRHIEWVNEFNKKEDLLLLSQLIVAAKKLAVKQKIDKACKFVFNIGKTGDINHIHLHLLGGWKKYI